MQKCQSGDVSHLLMNTGSQSLSYSSTHYTLNVILKVMFSFFSRENYCCVIIISTSWLSSVCVWAGARVLSAVDIVPTHRSWVWSHLDSSAAEQEKETMKESYVVAATLVFIRPSNTQTLLLEQLINVIYANMSLWFIINWNLSLSYQYCRCLWLFVS